MQLNELEEGMAPTDSRLRPDQRLMEEGRWDEANDLKLKLEEKQRYKRREREQEALRAVEEGGKDSGSFYLFWDLFVPFSQTCLFPFLGLVPFSGTCTLFIILSTLSGR